jgi:hypothetical protein
MFLKDLKMYHGNSKIIRRSTIDEDLRLIFLKGLKKQGPGFTTDMHIFARNAPRNEMDIAILEFLDRQQFNCNKTHIEYWYQAQEVSGALSAHVDFNEMLRHRINAGEHLKPEELMSPITIACYLEATDLIGGEFCISHKSWLDYDKEPGNPEVLREELLKYTHESFQPFEGAVLYFEGSRYYHWINEVKRGSRKSILINFWNDYSLKST